MITLFPNIVSITDRTRRRRVMVLVSPIVLCEYIVNSVIGFCIDFKRLWQA